MIKTGTNRYNEGTRTARKAMANGVPRWIIYGADDDPKRTHEIDLETGLPIGTISGPRELEESNTEFIRGYNDEILVAIKAGKIKVDFRPLLMTYSEVKEAFQKCFLGTLSIENSQIEDPSGRFVLRIKISKPRKNSKSLAWIFFDQKIGTQSRDLFIFEPPEDVALGKHGQVFILKTKFLFLVYDVQTTLLLSRYPLAG